MPFPPPGDLPDPGIEPTFPVAPVLPGRFFTIELPAAAAAATAAKSLQSCVTLCDPIDASPPGSPVPGILQARTLERVAISFSNTELPGKPQTDYDTVLYSHLTLLGT